MLMQLSINDATTKAENNPLQLATEGQHERVPVDGGVLNGLVFNNDFHSKSFKNIQESYERMKINRINLHHLRIKLDEEQRQDERRKGFDANKVFNLSQSSNYE